MVEAVLTGALITACCGLIATIIAKLRCRILVSKSGGWSIGFGFSEVKLPPPPPQGGASE